VGSLRIDAGGPVSAPRLETHCLWAVCGSHRRCARLDGGQAAVMLRFPHPDWVVMAIGVLHRRAVMRLFDGYVMRRNRRRMTLTFGVTGSGAGGLMGIRSIPAWSMMEIRLR
jgi:hypothetical protein